MVRASQISVQLFQKQIPYDDYVLKLVEDEYFTAADKKNRLYALKVNLKNVNSKLQHILYDPQTSGGLLISMPREDFSQFQDRLRGAGQDAWMIGEVLGKDPKGRVEII
jgi:selenide,water dikinase